MKKTLMIFLLSIMTALTLSACGRMTAGSNESDTAADITTGSAVQVSDLRKDALQAYYDLLSQEKYQNEDADCMKTCFAVSDLNADGIPELLVNSTTNIMEIDQYYTYENGTATKIEGPSGNDGYPRNIGSLYLLPSRNTYAFFLKGPSGVGEDKIFSQSFSLIEYAIIDHQICMINNVYWEIYDPGSRESTAKCTWNDKPCTLDEIMNQYPLEKTTNEDNDYLYFNFSSQEQEYNGIDFLYNTEANRKAVCTDSDPAVYALNAYYEILSGEEYRNPGGDDKIMGTHYAIADLNTDGIPELLISADSNMLTIYEWYTFDYKNGTTVKIDGRPKFNFYGSLYTLPSRGTFAFFRGGPAYMDEEDGQSYMPYTLEEFSLDLEKQQITATGGGSWEVNNDSGKLSQNTGSCNLNGKECSPEDVIEEFQLKKTKNEYDIINYDFPEADYIELLPNTDAKRKAIITEPKSDRNTDHADDESESDNTDDDLDDNTDTIDADS